MYDRLLEIPPGTYDSSDFASAVGSATIPDDEVHWVGGIPGHDGVYWTPGRFPSDIIEDPAWLTSEAATDAEVVSLPICMAEMDDGTFVEQGRRLDAAIAQGLPEPSVVVISGDPRIEGGTPGKSLHMFWTLDTAFTIAEIVRWKRIQRALISELGGDPKISNPSRKMRLGGVTGIKRHQTVLAVGEIVSRDTLEQWAADQGGGAFSSIGAAATPTRSAASHDMAGSTIVTDGSSEMTVENWYDSADVDDRWNVQCPFSDSTTTGSAFLTKTAWGARCTCNAAHHGHDGSRADGITLWVWRSGFVFIRGDDVEVARRVMDVDAGADNLVSARSRQYLFDEHCGLWVEDGTEGASVLFGSIAGYAGHACATPQGTRPLKMGNNFIGAALRNISSFTHYPRYFDDAPEGVPCKNGFLDGNGKLHPLQREHRVADTDVFPLSYEEKAKCPRWLKFLDEVFEPDADSPEKIGLVQEFLGACLFSKATYYQRHVILLGPKGSNGKSVLLKTVKSLFPTGTVASSPMQDWSRQFGLSWVPGTRLNVITEMPERDLLDSGPVKAVLTGDPRSIEEKYKGAYDAVPKAGHILAANTMPFVADHTEAFYRRFMVLGFERVFSPSEQDPDLVGKLAKEREGIFAWAVEGYKRLKNREDYIVPESSIELIEQWALGSDSTAAFARDHLAKVKRPKKGERTKGSSSSSLYSVYQEWCQDVGRRSVGQRKFSEGLSREDFEDIRVYFGKSRTRAWRAAIRSTAELPKRAKIAATVNATTLTFMDEDTSLVGAEEAFIAERVVLDNRAWCGRAALFEVYEGLVGGDCSLKRFGKVMREFGAKIAVKRVDGKRMRGWKVALCSAPDGLSDRVLNHLTVDDELPPS